MPVHAQGLSEAVDETAGATTADGAAMASEEKPRQPRTLTSPPSPRSSSRGRPRIGLALSGGGARGVAHIGVLKALEELRVPIDFVAGTSMGAIVGGLYASGMSPGELEHWFREVDWRYLLSDAPPREARPLRTTERELRMNQNLELGLSSAGVQLPVGFIAGQKLIVNMRQLTLPVRNVRDFDRLPIPFRAVATDLETGGKVVLGSGHLAEAMRASMAVPGVFTPYRIDGRLLVDGGLASNLPVETVRAMGADVVIAVDLRTDFLKEAALDSVVAITNQVLDILIHRETITQVKSLGASDVYVRLEVPGVASGNFLGSTAAIPLGYEETMERAAELRRLSVGADEYRARLARQRLPRQSGLQLSFIKVAAPTGEVRRSLEREIPFEPGERLEFWQLEKELLGLEGMRNTEIVDFRIIEENGRDGVLLITRPKRQGPNFLHAGFDFAYGSDGEADANMLFSYRMTELNALGAEWETFLSIGDLTRIFSEWNQPFESSRRFFFAPHVLYASEFIEGLNAGGLRQRFRLQELLAGADVGVRIADFGELRLGYARGVSRIGRALGLPEDTPSAADRGEVRASLTFDTLDRTNFPTHGYYAKAVVTVSREELGGRENYAKLDAQAYKPITVGKNTWVPRVIAGLALGGSGLPIYERFSLGGFLRLSGFPRRGLYDQNAVLGELVYYREVAELPPAIGRAIYAGFSVEAGNVWAEMSDLRLDDLIFGGSLFLGADTIFGPLQIGFGAAEGGEASVYLQLAPTFHQGHGPR